jgi:hypothetical protein
MVMSGAMLGGGGDMVGDMALQIAFPILKPHIEEQVRRATVTVRWHEGDHEREISVVQFLVAEQPPALVTETAASILTGTAPPLSPPPVTPPGGR